MPEKTEKRDTRKTLRRPDRSAIPPAKDIAPAFEPAPRTPHPEIDGEEAKGGELEEKSR